jgi:chromosome segregation ATPase
MTKQQERDALNMIKGILEDAGKDSYIGMAFSGCVEDAESNIDNDWALSMADRWKSSEQKLEQTTARADELQSVVDAKTRDINAMKIEMQHLQSDLKMGIDCLHAKSEELEKERAAADSAARRAEAAEAEIIRLKAKLYDFMMAK